MLFWSRQDLNAAEEAFKAAVDLAAPRSSVWQKYVDFKLRTGAAAEAKATLEDMIRKLPDYLPPRVYLMKIVCGEDNAQGCAANVQNILAQDPVNSEALFQNGSLSLAKGDAQTAVRQFEELGTMYPRSPQVRYQLARAYLLNATTATEVRARILTEAAEKQLIVAIELDPHFDQAILLLAELKMRKGSAAAAVDLLAPLTKERPQIVRAQNLLAAAYLAQQKRDQALAVYRQMTELFPKDPQPPFAIGAILLTQRQQPEARKAFERSAEISPNYLPAVEMLTDLDIADKQYGTAMERIQKLIDNDPNRAQPWALRAKIYLAQRDFKRAEADLLKAIELDPNLVPGYLALAQLYEASNRQEQAIEKLNESMQRNKSVPALTLLAMIQEKQKNFTAARDAYEKLLAMAPNSSLALNNLALLYSEHLGEFDKAYDLAKKAREADPKQPQLADTLGWLLFKKGDYGNALRLLQESSDKLPDSPEIQFHVGMAQYMLGDEGPARVALQKAADASVDFTGKDEARQRLALMAVDVEAGNPGARTELENYLRERPDDPAALVRLARVQVREGAVDRAVKTYEKVVADYPLYAPATRQLAVLYGQSSTDEPKAYELVTKARQVYPADPEIAKTLGILNYRRQYYPQSAELLKEAAAKLKDDPEIAYYLGEVYRQLKQYSECKETLQRALRLNLSPGLAVDARGALAECSDAAP
jgi:tetratricopeptide (TPR) repeat protein